MPWKTIPAEYKGVKYGSMSKLYKAMRDHLAKYAHRDPSLSYTYFLEEYKKTGDIDTAVRRMTEKRPLKYDTDLKADSKRLEGADNLVSQRMTKLGWSYEKAVSTPKVTKHLPIQVVYKGKVYKSIAECHRAVKPDMNLVYFAKFLKSKRYIVK